MIEYIGNEFTYLLPGELIVTSEALKISTVLGSCVAVCLYDQARRIAGMNHYPLPYNTTNDPNIYKYGNTSLEDMLDKMIRSGAIKNFMVARIYGGSSMFTDQSKSHFNIGERNVEVALNFLNHEGIHINNIETGGRSGRKVVFDTSAGVISSNILTERKR